MKAINIYRHRMIDIISIIVASTSLVVAVLIHIRHSKCIGGLFEIDTREPLLGHEKENN